MSARAWSNLWAMLFGLSLGLLFCGTGHAAGLTEPKYPPYCWVQPPGTDLWYPCDSDEAKLANCLVLMETAMKAVDPYLDSMSLPAETRERTLKLWDRAKNSCWSDLRDKQPQHYH